ncbi:LEAF RUST 10 DISEASE-RESISTANCEUS RECEPTOR-LIKE PROTEIN KINASE-like 2.4 [Aristolochia californica]|uniref:LEAF RUST 10 DISEASE-RESISTANCEUS RECEPTOR-LIKE PROTEIN KINASE-like 2.4 n=1 Tax=Aristolochia californica TaxID=171875 RepID=UPI0035D59E44
MASNTIELKLISCKDLKAFNFFQKLFVYAVTVLGTGDGEKGSRKQLQKTPIDREGGGNPEWHHEVRFDLDEIPSGGLNSLFIEIDLICSGWVKSLIKSRLGNGGWVVSSSNWAESLARASISQRNRFVVTMKSFGVLPGVFAAGGYSCQPSSCRNIPNISYPFRLKGDPDRHCGDDSYELECRNNQTVLDLKSSKYYVKQIFYETRRIRVVDASLGSSICSSIPQNTSLIKTLSDRFYAVGDPKYFEYGGPYILAPEVSKTIVLVSCPVPINHSSYISAGVCGENTSTPSNVYAIAGSIKISDLPPLCDVVAKYPTPFHGILSPGNTNILQILSQGFDISWKEQLACRHCFAQNKSCADFMAAMGQDLWIYGKPHGHCVYYDCRGVDRNGLLTRVLCQLEKITYTTLKLFIPDSLMSRADFRLEFLIAWLEARTLIAGLCFAAILIYKCKTRSIWMDTAVEEFLLRYKSQAPKRYSYRDIKKMTKGFKEKLGQGGYGSVFKGKLTSGRHVAVKMLSKSKGDGQDFINEVATIGRIHHVNVVSLVGFCSQGSKRALIYEFMPNGSLEKYIFPQEGEAKSLSWEKIHEIALGIARGLEYMHRGCDMRILHFDIKPHNILLDENFIPKISDFGLAKLSPAGKSFVTMTAARGTIGYMAPELFYQNIGKVSYKSDVYSYGMLLMDMAGRRKYINPLAEHSSQIVFHLWAYDQLQQGGDLAMGKAKEDEKEIIEKLITVALWCVQMKPSDRPSMSGVLEMLQGCNQLLSMPGKPFLSSPPRVLNGENAPDISRSSSVYEVGSQSQTGAETTTIDMITN